MTMIDRYLAAIGANLPRRQRDDILRELADDLKTRADERAAALGRPLSDEEQAELLRDFGEPMSVAARFRPEDRGLTFGRRLVGPELFPSYVRVLAINLAITLGIGAVLWIVGVRASVGGAAFGVAVTFAIQFLIVTVLFIAIDRRYATRPGAWNPKAMPGGYPPEALLDDLADVGAVRDGRVSRVASVVSLAWLVVVLAWWLAMPVIVATTTPFQPGPGWTSVFVPGLLLFGIWMAQPLVNLARPELVGFRTATRIVGEAATIVVASVSLAIGDWLVLTDPGAASADVVNLELLIEQVIGVLIVGVMVVSALSIVAEVRADRRRRSSDQGR